MVWNLDSRPLVFFVGGTLSGVRYYRKPRVHYDGLLYYVICRGNNRELTPKSDEYKLRYLELIAQYKAQYNFKSYTWVILSNDIHLLIEVGKVPLSKIMQGIQQYEQEADHSIFYEPHDI